MRNINSALDSVITKEYSCLVENFPKNKFALMKCKLEYQERKNTKLAVCLLHKVKIENKIDLSY